jgi:hypothetical protein
VSINYIQKICLNEPISVTLREESGKYMIGKIHDKGERELFRPRLEDFMDTHHALALPAKNFPFYFSTVFSTKSILPYRLKEEF